MDYLENISKIINVLFWLSGFFLIFDIYFFLNRTKGNTISNRIKDWVYDKFFVITFLWGVFAGHFFLGSKRKVFENFHYNFIIILEISLILLVFGIYFKIKIKPIGQVLLLLFGLLVGHYFWSINI